MRRILIVMLAFVLLCTYSQAVSAAELSPRDRAYLIRAAASSYPDVGFGGRVGICAVILNRMDDDRFPDTAADVVAYFGDGCFASFAEPDAKSRRLTEDALDMALSGADPTDGALYFSVLDDGSPVYDLRFDNSGEKRLAQDVENAARHCTAVIDGIGFEK